MFDSIVVFPNFMPIVQESYFHSPIPLKRSGNLIGFMADIPGSYLREVAKGIKYKMLACSVPERKENVLDYTPSHGTPHTCFSKDTSANVERTCSHRQLLYTWPLLFSSWVQLYFKLQIKCVT